MLSKTVKEKLYAYVDKQEEISPKLKSWLKTYPIKFFDILSGLTMFILKFWIMKRIFIDKIYVNDGFEIALLTMFILYIVLTKINMKSLVQSEDDEQEKKK